MCFYINVVIHWWCDFVQQYDGKRRTHEWLLKEDSYYVHHIWYNEYFNNEHHQRQFILCALFIISKLVRCQLGKASYRFPQLIRPQGGRWSWGVSHLTNDCSIKRFWRGIPSLHQVINLIRNKLILKLIILIIFIDINNINIININIC